eukprot:1153155-Pelagomonas_calceolata.AAC.1
MCFIGAGHALVQPDKHRGATFHFATKKPHVCTHSQPLFGQRHQHQHHVAGSIGAALSACTGSKCDTLALTFSLASVISVTLLAAQHRCSTEADSAVIWLSELFVLRILKNILMPPCSSRCACAKLPCVERHATCPIDWHQGIAVPLACSVAGITCGAIFLGRARNEASGATLPASKTPTIGAASPPCCHLLWSATAHTVPFISFSL